MGNDHTSRIRHPFHFRQSTTSDDISLFHSTILFFRLKPSESFQSLSGIRLLFHTGRRVRVGGNCTRFNPSQGLGCFSTQNGPTGSRVILMGFNPSQGLGCFSTRERRPGCRRAQRFQSLSGIRLLFHMEIGDVHTLDLGDCFNPSQGLGCFSTESGSESVGPGDFVSIPLRD